jgi:DNA-binding transcriptional ArsR family regulator
MPVSPSDLVAWLRAAGEPSRLRLLALCADAAATVSDLAQALRQSEPRVSRHLKILCQAGLIVRLRQGQWVHYRAAETAEAASFVRGLLAQVDRRDPLLSRDRSGARTAAATLGAHAPESRLGRALAGFSAASGLGAPIGSALLVGVAHVELLEAAARAATRCLAIAPSRRAAQSARAFAEQRALKCRVLQASAPEPLSEEDIARAGAAFDAVLLDQAVGEGDALARMVMQARRLLTPNGRLWIFERYESLEGSRERVVEHPLARLRRLLGEAGLVCERLSPLEAEGEHVLAAAARPLAMTSGQLIGTAGRS